MDDAVDRLADLLARIIARRWITKCAEEQRSGEKDAQAATEQDDGTAGQDDNIDLES